MLAEMGSRTWPSRRAVRLPWEAAHRRWRRWMLTEMDSRTWRSQARIASQFLPGSATGRLTAPRTVFVGRGVVALAVADFNRDRIADLAVLSPDGSVQLLPGYYPSISQSPLSVVFFSFRTTPFPTGTFPYSATVGDFNGDGIPDLAIGSNQSQSLTLLLGDGIGGFSAAPGSPFPTGINPSSVTVGDFNGDGKADLATANATSNNVTVLLNNGSGGFSPAPGSPFPAGCFLFQ